MYLNVNDVNYYVNCCEIRSDKIYGCGIFFNGLIVLWMNDVDKIIKNVGKCWKFVI